MLRILAVTRKPDSASFLQRVGNYVSDLGAMGLHVQSATLPQPYAQQKRFLHRLAEYDLIWWHRHLLTPLLWPALRRVPRPIVFDFDDPLMYTSRGGGQPSFTRRVRFRGMLRRCTAAFAASEHLAAQARPYCPRVEIVPMAVDLPADPPTHRPLVEGRWVELLWLGSRMTQPYLEIIRPALERVGGTFPHVRLRLVAHEPMRFGSLTVDFRRWSEAEQEQALRECHLGLCPMPDTVWTRGKCPYKVLQYMACGMPWVGSAVGENVVMSGGAGQGLCADSETEWFSALRELVGNEFEREELGRRGREYVQQRHSRKALSDQIATLMRRLLADAR